MAATGLGAAAAAILDGKLPGDAVKPILARRKAIEQSIEETKRQEREEHQIARAKKALNVQPHQKLRVGAGAPAVVGSHAAAHDPVLEKKLKKIATQGIVALFNAVRDAQGVRVKEKAVKRKRIPEKGDEAVEVSKDSFLDILRRGAGGSAAGGGAGGAGGAAVESSVAGRASYLRDDYLIGKKQRTKDFGADLAEDEEDVDNGMAKDEAEFDDDEF